MEGIAVLGLGYIGLPTATVLALNGHTVTGVDTDRQLLKELAGGKTRLQEPELETAFKEALFTGHLHLASRPPAADTYIIAVPTPSKTGSSCDLGFVLEALESTLPCLVSGNLVIIESTIPPLTCREQIIPLLEKAGFHPGQDIFLAHCPERVLPGCIMREIVENDRVIGGYTGGCSQRAAAIYRSFCLGNLFLTDLGTAEMVKLMENTFRDVNIALANEMARICNRLGINILEAIALANRHPRVDYLSAGPGVGGHCLAVDPYFIVEKAPDLASLILTARQVNSRMPEYIVDICRQLTAGRSDPRVTLFGLSYKGNVADLRESPALEIKRLLLARGFVVTAYDPFFPDLSSSLPVALSGSDLIIVLCEHDEFTGMDYSQITRAMRTAQVLDTRDIIHPYQPWQDCMLYNLGNLKPVKS